MAEDAKTEAGRDGLVTQEVAGRVIGMSTSWLSKDRTGDRPPVVPFVKLGRAVRYRMADLRKLAGAV